jgi:hypothetical protein
VNRTPAQQIDDANDAHAAVYVAIVRRRPHPGVGSRRRRSSNRRVG